MLISNKLLYDPLENSRWLEISKKWMVKAVQHFQVSSFSLVGLMM